MWNGSNDSVTFGVTRFRTLSIVRYSQEWDCLSNGPNRVWGMYPTLSPEDGNRFGFWTSYSLEYETVTKVVKYSNPRIDLLLFILSFCQYLASNDRLMIDGWWLGNDFGKKWHALIKAVVVAFRQRGCGKSRKIGDSWWSGRDMNSTAPEYVFRALPLQ
jgi:hypothetical protein